MNNHNDLDSQAALVAQAATLATAHAQGLEQHCRRWRRRATVRRLLVMTLLALAILFAVGSISSSLANQTYATGSLATDEAVANVRQMLKNQ